MSEIKLGPGQVRGRPAPRARKPFAVRLSHALGEAYAVLREANAANAPDIEPGQPENVVDEWLRPLLADLVAQADLLAERRGWADFRDRKEA